MNELLAHFPKVKTRCEINFTSGFSITKIYLKIN